MSKSRCGSRLHAPGPAPAAFGNAGGTRPRRRPPRPGRSAEAAPCPSTRTAFRERTDRCLRRPCGRPGEGPLLRHTPPRPGTGRTRAGHADRAGRPRIPRPGPHGHMRTGPDHGHRGRPRSWAAPSQTRRRTFPHCTRLRPMFPATGRMRRAPPLPEHGRCPVHRRGPGVHRPGPPRRLPPPPPALRTRGIAPRPGATAARSPPCGTNGRPTGLFSPCRPPPTTRLRSTVGFTRGPARTRPWSGRPRPGSPTGPPARRPASARTRLPVPGPVPARTALRHRRRSAPDRSL